MFDTATFDMSQLLQVQQMLSVKRPVESSEDGPPPKRRRLDPAALCVTRLGQTREAKPIEFTDAAIVEKQRDHNRIVHNQLDTSSNALPCSPMQADQHPSNGETAHVLRSQGPPTIPSTTSIDREALARNSEPDSRAISSANVQITSETKSKKKKKKKNRAASQLCCIQLPQMQGRLLSSRIKAYTIIKFQSEGSVCYAVPLERCCDIVNFFDAVTEVFNLLTPGPQDAPLRVRCIVNQRIQLVVEEDDERTFGHLLHCVSVDMCWGYGRNARCFVEVELL